MSVVFGETGRELADELALEHGVGLGVGLGLVEVGEGGGVQEEEGGGRKQGGEGEEQEEVVGGVGLEEGREVGGCLEVLGRLLTQKDDFVLYLPPHILLIEIGRAHV